MVSLSCASPIYCIPMFSSDKTNCTQGKRPWEVSILLNKRTHQFWPKIIMSVLWVRAWIYFFELWFSSNSGLIQKMHSLKKHPCSPKARRPWWRFCSKVSRWIPFKSSKCLQVPGLSQLQPLVSKRIQQLDISPGNPTQFDTWPSFVYQLTYCILAWLKMLWIFSQWTINYLGKQKGAGPFQLQ